MSIDRRKVIGLIGASAATVLAGCGGGGYQPPPTRFVWLLNLNPEFLEVDVSFGATTVAVALPFQALTARIEVEYGSYTVALRDRSDNFTVTFGVVIDATSPSVLVFYRRFLSSRLGSAPLGIVNYFDSTVPLDVDLFDGGNLVQLVDALQFEGSEPQVSNSFDCELDLFATGFPGLIYNSGLRPRTDSIIVFPRFPAGLARSGEVAVVGLNHGLTSASVAIWSNSLG